MIQKGSVPFCTILGIFPLTIRVFPRGGYYYRIIFALERNQKIYGYEKVSIVYGIDGSHNDSRCPEKRLVLIRQKQRKVFKFVSNTDINSYPHTFIR